MFMQVINSGDCVYAGYQLRYCVYAGYQFKSQMIVFMQVINSNLR